jgi:hypothetical protein
MLLSVLVAQLKLPTAESGIFEHAFGYTILHPSRALVDHPWLTMLLGGGRALPGRRRGMGNLETDTGNDFWTPFSGGGHRLGSGSRRDDAVQNATTEEVSRLV